jgi:YD repeat-containing protein
VHFEGEIDHIPEVALFMPQQRDTATDRLLNVIQVIQLGRKSGLLSVERGEGIQFEEGMIMFVNGQATQASVGQRTGLEAFNWLSTWNACLFSFIPSSTTASGALFTTPAIPNTSNSTFTDTNSYLHAQQGTNGRLQAQQGTNGRLQAQHNTNGRLQAQHNTNGRLQAQHNTNGRLQAQQPAVHRQTAFPQKAEERERNRSIQTPGSDSTGPNRTRRLEDGLRLIEQAGFTRAHRRLFLLIDGSRSTAELVRLMGREQHEVRILLNQLEEAGLIQL